MWIKASGNITGKQEIKGKSDLIWKAGLFIGCIKMKEQIIQKGELLDVGSENGFSKLDLLDIF